MNFTWSVTNYSNDVYPSRSIVEGQVSSRDLSNRQDLDVDDILLIQDIALSSTVALTQFYKKHESTVTAFALRYLSNQQDCMDILNEVMLTVWTSAGSYAARSKVRTWLLSITYHKIMDYFRRQQRELISCKNFNDSLPVDNVDLNETIDSIETIKICLNKLSPTHREIIHLAFFEDLSCNEIAEILACPIGTVKTRLMHARIHLKRMLNEAHHSPKEFF